MKEEIIVECWETKKGGTQCPLAYAFVEVNPVQEKIVLNILKHHSA